MWSSNNRGWQDGGANFADLVRSVDLIIANGEGPLHHNNRIWGGMLRVLDKENKPFSWPCKARWSIHWRPVSCTYAQRGKWLTRNKFSRKFLKARIFGLSYELTLLYHGTNTNRANCSSRIAKPDGKTYHDAGTNATNMNAAHILLQQRLKSLAIDNFPLKPSKLIR